MELVSMEQDRPLDMLGASPMEAAYLDIPESVLPHLVRPYILAQFHPSQVRGQDWGRSSRLRLPCSLRPEQRQAGKKRE